jgi:hypothetical protein
MSTKFTENRNLYHTFSRVAIQEGQGVAAAVNKTGHTVTTNDVWSDIDKLPKNTAYFGNANTAFDDLKTVYEASSAEFSKYVKLYENAVLSPVDGSGQDANKNQAWELLVDGKRVKNFIAPTDVFDANGQPCNGYTLKLFDKGGTQIAATDGNWAFDYVAGLVIFERGKTPEDMKWATTSNGVCTAPITISAWAYVGDVLSKTLTNIDQKIGSAKSELNEALNEAKQELNTTISNLDKTLMAVKPFTWEVDTAMYDAELVDTGNIDGEGKAIMANPVINGIEVPAGSKYIEVPAIVFNVFNAVTGVAYGDINYIDGGKTLIVFEDWNDEMFGGEKTFVAYGFVLGNGNPITVLESSTLEKPVIEG